VIGTKRGVESVSLLAHVLERKDCTATAFGGLSKGRVAPGVRRVAINVGQLGRVAEGVEVIEVGDAAAALADHVAVEKGFGRVVRDGVAPIVEFLDDVVLVRVPEVIDNRHGLPRPVREQDLCALILVVPGVGLDPRRADFHLLVARGVEGESRCPGGTDGNDSLICRVKCRSGERSGFILDQPVADRIVRVRRIEPTCGRRAVR